MPWARNRAAGRGPGHTRGSGRPPTRSSSIARTLRIAWWPRFLVAGLVLAVVGYTLLTGWAQALMALGGAVVFVFAAAVALLGKSWDQDRMREPPMPPGAGAPSEILLPSR